MISVVPTRPSPAPCSPPSRPRRAASGGGLRPVLTAAARGATLTSGRDEETASAIEQRNFARYRIFLQNFPDTTAVRKPTGLAGGETRRPKADEPPRTKQLRQRPVSTHPADSHPTRKVR